MKSTTTVILICLAVLAITGNARATLYGNPLVERTYATDYPVALGASSPVLVVEPIALPNGTLNSFETWDQVEPGGSPFSSAGNTLTAFILQPTGTPNQYTEVFSSGLLTVPTVASSQVATFSVNPFTVESGDLIAYYGQGVPVDITGAGNLELYYPTLTGPTLNQTFTLGSADFPQYQEDRLYSFAANITPIPEPTTLISGALILLPFGASTLRILRRNRVG